MARKMYVVLLVTDFFLWGVGGREHRVDGAHSRCSREKPGTVGALYQ